MADVGIERLAAGDDEKDRAKDNETGVRRCARQKIKAVQWIERAEHSGAEEFGRSPQRGKQKPENRDRPKHLPYARRAAGTGR